MRVEVAAEIEESSEKLEIPWESSDQSAGYLDLRENTALVEQLPEARQHPPLRSFLAAVNSDDSFFSTARCKTWLRQEEPVSHGPATAEPCEFASRMDLVFTLEEFNFDRSHYDDLTQRLQDLLTRESAADALRAELRMRLCRFRKLGRWGFCLAILLYARGRSPEQAELRWGLGLARVQQALLFVSRILRHQIAQAS